MCAGEDVVALKAAYTRWAGGLPEPFRTAALNDGFIDLLAAYVNELTSARLGPQKSTR